MFLIKHIQKMITGFDGYPTDSLVQIYALLPSFNQFQPFKLISPFKSLSFTFAYHSEMSLTKHIKKIITGF